MKTVNILAIFVVSLGWVESASSQEAQSPFVRPSKVNAAPAQKTTPASPLDAMEFNGVVEIGGVAWLSLYDPQTKKSYWLSKDEAAEDGITLERYDAGKQPGEETIVVRQGAMTRKLTLKDADIISLKAAPRPAVQRAAQSVAQARPQAPARPRQPPTMEAASDEEVRERMQRVAEEIRRRRTLRRDVVDDGSGGSN